MLNSAYKAAQKDPKLHLQEVCPGEGWEWVCKSPTELAALDSKNIQKGGLVHVPKELGKGGYICFWCRELPFDPIKWIAYYYGHWHRGVWLGQKPKEPPSVDESLACECAVLAVVYDNAQNLPDCNRLISPNNPSDRLWADLLWVDIEAFGYEGQTRTYGQRQNTIQSALDHVKADLTEKAAKNGGQASDGEPNLPDYRALNLAERTITIGIKPYFITSERVWDFLKDLCTAFKEDRIVPMYEGAIKNKNAVDQLRRKVGGKDNLRKLIIFIKGGYKIKSEVKILYSGQKGIRKTHLKKARATHERH